VDACNPLLQVHPTWAQDEHEGRGIPTSFTPVSGRLALPPSRSPSHSTHLSWGTRRHSLVGPGTPPVSKRRHQARLIRQKLRRFTPGKREAIRAELARLVAAGFIREVLHPEWLANPVLVLKKNKVDWRMCVDYTDLNKHCRKDPFGLPRIDQVVDSTAGCSVLSFLDCYSGYHQISLAKEDKEKTAVITPFGAFCYTSMSFGLKNTGATYQRAIQTCLADHWGKRVEAYVDDMVIKTENSENFIENLQLVFNSLRRYRWKLNPEKIEAIMRM
jgi:hypothetical protein